MYLSYLLFIHTIVYVYRVQLGFFHLFLWVVFVNKWHVHVCKYKKQISHHGNELKNIACCSFTLSNNKLT